AALGRRASRAVLGIKQRIGRAESGHAGDAHAPLYLDPLRPRAADVVVRAQRPPGADPAGRTEAADEADQVLGVATERGQLHASRAPAVAEPRIHAPAALGPERGVAEIGVQLEQCRR